MAKVIDTINYYLFPYECIEKGSDVILYGFGKVGKQYYKQIEASQYCNIKYVVDEKIAQEKKLNFVYDSSFIHFEKNVKVVVSIQNPILVSQLFALLKEKGFTEKDIVYTRHKIPLPYVWTGKTVGAFQKFFESDEAKQEYGNDFFSKYGHMVDVLKINSCKNLRLVRCGGEYDGAYVMSDFCFAGEKIAYSFGIGSNVSWDEAMARRGFEIYMYDHTIKGLPYEKKEFHFFRKGISCTAESDGTLDTLEDIIRENQHLGKKNMILKMDVEGAEYGALLNTTDATLQKFDQVVIEFHDLLQIAHDPSILAAIEKLTALFATVHVHANLCGGCIYIDEKPYPNLLEVTLLNRRNYDFSISGDVYLPIDLDMPNQELCDDIILGNWNSR